MLEESTLRAFLLGLLREEDADKVDEWWFVDESGDNTKTLQRIAKALVEDYSNDQLEPAERHAFEKDGRRTCAAFLREGHS